MNSNLRIIWLSMPRSLSWTTRSIQHFCLFTVRMIQKTINVPWKLMKRIVKSSGLGWTRHTSLLYKLSSRTKISSSTQRSVSDSSWCNQKSRWMACAPSKKSSNWLRMQSKWNKTIRRHTTSCLTRLVAVHLPLFTSVSDTATTISMYWSTLEWARLKSRAWSTNAVWLMLSIVII